MKRNIFIFFVFISLFSLNTTILRFRDSIAARVGDKVVTRSEVEAKSRLFNISYEQAFAEILEFEVLHRAAKINGYEPDDKDVVEVMKSEKMFYATHHRKTVDEVSDAEFLNAAGIGNGTLADYLDYTKKRVMISGYLNELYEKAALSKMFVDPKDVNEYIVQNQGKFVKPETYEIQMIYFSYFDRNGNLFSDSDIAGKVRKAAECLNELKSESNFGKAALKYSDDRLSLQSNPPGYMGRIERNDSHMQNRFSDEIINAFSKEDIGVIHKVFGTDNGLYIFKLISRQAERMMSEAEIRNIAENHIRTENLNNKRREIRTEKVEEFKRHLNVIVY